MVVDGTVREVQPLGEFAQRQVALASEQGDDGVAA
jgi:hypothetical protein